MKPIEIPDLTGPHPEAFIGPQSDLVAYAFMESDTTPLGQRLGPWPWLTVQGSSPASLHFTELCPPFCLN